MEELTTLEIGLLLDFTNEVFHSAVKKLEDNTLGDIERRLTEQRKKLAFNLLKKLELIN